MNNQKVKVGENNKVKYQVPILKLFLNSKLLFFIIVIIIIIIIISIKFLLQCLLPLEVIIEINNTIIMWRLIFNFNFYKFYPYEQILVCPNLT
jgi:hypothetical protein